MQYLITEQGGFGKVVNYDYVGHYEYNSTEHRITLLNVITFKVIVQTWEDYIYDFLSQITYIVS